MRRGPWHCRLTHQEWYQWQVWRCCGGRHSIVSPQQGYECLLHRRGRDRWVQPVGGGDSFQHSQQEFTGHRSRLPYKGCEHCGHSECRWENPEGNCENLGAVGRSIEDTSHQWGCQRQKTTPGMGDVGELRYTSNTFHFLVSGGHGVVPQ